MKLLRKLLYPLSIIYNLITTLRNFLYNKKILSSAHFEIPLINVGNLSVGGTGKTPMVEYIINLLSDQLEIAVLSRGYKRKTKGNIIAQPNHTAKDLGDEPYQVFKKLGHKVVVAVGEERALAIPEILSEHPNTKAIILDDAFQHRSISPNLNILLTPYCSPFYKDLLLPAGNLRESRVNAKRADVIVVTKCPHKLSDAQKNAIKEKIALYAKKDMPIFFSQISYDIPQNVFTSEKTESENIQNDSALVVTGIAESESFLEYIKESYKKYSHLKYSDHHNYTNSDIQNILKRFKETPCKHKYLITTEKDAVKLKEFDSLKEISCFYIPIKTKLADQKKFDQLILNSFTNMH